MDGLSQYIQSWASVDPNVGHWINGERAVGNPTADIGGWLADYVYTCFCKLSGQVKHSARYRVVPNKMYGSLFRMLSTAIFSRDVTRGNVLEHLCWHAYEQRRGVFVLAIVWQATNRSLPEQPFQNATATVNTLQCEPRVQRIKPINIKKDIFAPLNAKCVWNEDTNRWTVPASKGVDTSICDWVTALAPNYLELKNSLVGPLSLQLLFDGMQSNRTVIFDSRLGIHAKSKITTCSHKVARTMSTECPGSHRPTKSYDSLMKKILIPHYGGTCRPRAWAWQS